MKKRKLALVLILVLLAGLFSACASGGAPTSQSSAGNSGSSGATTQAAGTTASQVEPAGYDGVMPIVEKTMTLSFMTHSGFASNLLPPDNNLPYYKATQEATNIQINWEVVATDSYPEVLQARLSAGVDLPDMINMHTNQYVVGAYQSGLLLPLDDLLDEYGYYTKLWLADGNGTYRQLWTQADGHIYSINDYNLTSYNQPMVMYNKSWLEQLGREVPKTLQEFEDLAYAMKGVDFNGNGKTDEIIVTGDLENFNTLGHSFGLEYGVVGCGFQVADDGKTVTCDWADDRYREFLTFSNKLYMDGILDPEIMLNNATMMTEKIASDRVGIVLYWSSYATTFSGLTPVANGNANMEVFTIGEPLEGPRGDKYMLYRVSTGGDCTAITSACKTPEIAMKWLDYVYGSQENQTLRYFGFEGQDYTLNSDSSKNIIQQEGSNFIERINSYGGGQVPFCHRQSLERSMLLDVEWKAKQQGYLQQFFKYGIVETTRTLEEDEIYSTYRPDIVTYVKEAEGLFISGEKPLDDDGWNSYLKTLENLRINDLTAVYQSRYLRDVGA